MDLRERFLEWKKAVLPESASGTVQDILANYAQWEGAKREAGRDFIGRADRFRDFVNHGKEEAFEGAVETIRNLRTLLEKAGVQCPPWKEPPEEDA